MARPKRSNEEKKPSAREFVASLPADTTADRAVELAEAAGVRLTKPYFHQLRARARSGEGANGKRRNGTREIRTVASVLASGEPQPGRAAETSTGPTEAAIAGTALRVASDDPHEQAIIAAVDALGLERVESIARVAWMFRDGGRADVPKAFPKSFPRRREAPAAVAVAAS